MVINRALFKLIDPSKKQITRGKAEREKVLRHYFESDRVTADVEDAVIKRPASQVRLIDNPNDSRLAINSFNKNPDEFYALNLASVKNKELDGLFVYTNLKRVGTLVACGDLVLRDDQYLCYKPVDLFPKYGYSVPPNELGREKGLKFLHIADLNEILEHHSHILVTFPNWPKSKDNYHQAVLKLDWYSNKSRIHHLQTPSVSSTRLSIPEDTVFSRFYLNDFSSILQAFELNKLYSESNCDNYLAMLKAYALLSSTVQVKFSSNQNEFIYSQILGTKSRNLTLRLGKNSVGKAENFVDFVNFDVRSLLLDTNKKEVSKLVCNNGHEFELKVAYLAILGQTVRFYLVLLPAFLAFHLQTFGFLTIANKAKSDDSLKNAFFVLNECQRNFPVHLIFCLGLTLLALLNKYIRLQTDFEVLTDQGVWTNGLVPLLFGISYGILSFLTFVFSIIFFLISFVASKIAKYFFRIQIFVFFTSFLIIVCGFSFASALGQCLIFYGEFISLACINPYFNNNPVKRSTVFTANLIRLFLLYLLIIVNMPSLLVWIKSTEFHGFKPAILVVGDPYLIVAMLSSLLHLIIYLKKNILPSQNAYKIKHEYLSAIILINAFVSVLYSCLNLHRLPYFILTHLFLMIFVDESVQDSKEKLE